MTQLDDQPRSASMTSLRGRVAVVTGGAGGIGAATATLLAEREAAVVVADIDQAGAERVAGAIEDRGGTASAQCTDVSDEPSVAELMSHALRRFGGLDILHNNAAAMGPDVLGRDGDLESLDLEVWERTLSVNLRGAMLGCKHAIPLMRQRGGGAIINTSSVAGEAGDIRFVAYGVSKAGINLLTKCVAARYGKEDIRCNAVAPGMVLTETAQRALSEADIASALRHHLTTRPGYPLDIAHAVAFLASDEGSFINGHILDVDGGVTAHLPHCADALALLAT